MYVRQPLICFVILVILSVVHVPGATPVPFPAALDAGYKVFTEAGANQVELSIRNSSDSYLQFTGDGVRLEGPDAAEFQIVHIGVLPLAFVMPPGDVRHVLIDFKPSTPGIKQASIVITTDSSTSPSVTVPITGTAVVARGTVASGRYDGFGPGMSTIGSGGDYDSLFAATADIRRYPLTGGDWTFLIIGNLVEQHNSVLGQRSTNGHRITFRPAPDTVPTVTFTTTTKNPGDWPGHFIIGAYVTHDVGSWRLRSCPTHNITIDGSDVPGGQTQSLTFMNLVRNTAATSLVQVHGNCDHVKIRNCRFLHAVPSGSDGDGIVDFAAVNNFQGNMFIPPDEVPDYGEISNCVISTTGTGHIFKAGIAVNVRSGQDAPYHIDPGSVGMTITSNTLTKLSSCINVRYCADAVISSNSLEIEYFDQPYRTSGSRSGIYSSVYQPEGGATTTTISGNSIRFIGDGPTNRYLTGLEVSSTATPNEIRITNNIISGLNGHAKGLPAYTFTPVYGIINSADQDCTVTIAHNSIHFVEDDDAEGTAPRCAAIHNATSNGYFFGKSIIRNNIIRMGTAGGCAITQLPRESHLPPATILSDHNIIYNSPGSYLAYLVQLNGSAIPYGTLTEWNDATGNDGNSLALDPFIAYSEGMGTWHGVANDVNPDLHFTSDPGDAYRVPSIDFISVDYDGDPRPALLTLAGADETVDAPSAVTDWAMY